MKQAYKRVVIGTIPQIKANTGGRIIFKHVRKKPAEVILEAKNNNIPITSLFPRVEVRGRYPKITTPQIKINGDDLVLVVKRIGGVLKFVQVKQIDEDRPPIFQQKTRHPFRDTDWR